MRFSAKNKLDLQEILQKEDEFYKKEIYFSYSSLKKLLSNPSVFYSHYILGSKVERKERHLLEGKIIHALLLSKSIFDSLFVVTPLKISESLKPVIDEVFKKHLELKGPIKSGSPAANLKDYRCEILEILKRIDLYQSFVDDKAQAAGKPVRTGDDKRIDKVLTPESLNYWEFLFKKGARDVIDQTTLDFCKAGTEKVRLNNRIMERMGFQGLVFSTAVEVYNEKEFYYKLKDFPFGIKGVIDNLVIDHRSKKILINDVKTTDRELKEFYKSVEHYWYWMQAVMYTLLIIKNYSALIGSGYLIEFSFIVIDHDYNVYAFQVSRKTMERWTSRFYNECLFKANYHYLQKKYTLPYEFEEELVIL